MDDTEILNKVLELLDHKEKLLDKAFNYFNSDILQAIKKESEEISKELKELRQLQIAERKY